MSRSRVLVAEPDDFDPEVERLLAAKVDLVMERTDRDGVARAMREFDAIWIRLGIRVDESTIGAAPRCRVLACPATGLDHIDVAACAARGVRVVSLKGEVELLREVRATAELTVALMLALLRNVPGAARSVLSGSWNRDRFRGHEIARKTIGIVGMGRLGTLVARMLGGFGCELVGFDPRPDFPSGLVARAASLDDLLARADVVTVHVAYDATTRHLFDAARFAQMKRGAWFVNTSRGGVVDEGALLDALTRGHLAGAALDVIEGEPAPDLADGALLRHARAHENLIVVPHIGGNTWESTRMTEAFVARKLLAALGIEVAS